MNHIYSIILFKNQDNKNAYVLAQAEDTSNLPFIARVSGKGSEFLKFISRTSAERIIPGNPYGFKEDNFMCWVYPKSEGMIGVAITDDLYPKRIALDFINKCITKYLNKETSWDWSLTNEDRVNDEKCPDLYALLIKYKNPLKADSLENCKNEIDKTKICLHKSIDTLLYRGEKIEILADKSADLSKSSKDFARKAKKLNSWCPNGCNIM